MSRTAYRPGRLQDLAAPRQAEPDPYEPARIFDPERRAMTAIHEAAHAVSALVLGLPPFRMVEIDDSGNGRVLHPVQWHSSVAHHIIFLLAGAAGEAVHSGRPVLELWPPSAKTTGRRCWQCCATTAPATCRLLYWRNRAGRSSRRTGTRSRRWRR